MQETRVQSIGWQDSPGEGNGNPLQYSCLENPMDRGAWWATVHGVVKSRTWLSNFTSQPRKGTSPRCWREMVQRQRDFYERRGKASRIHINSNLPDQVIKARSLSPARSCPKGGAGGLQSNLRAQDKENYKCFHRFPVCICILHVHGAIWKKRGILTAENKQVFTEAVKSSVDLALSQETPVIEESSDWIRPWNRP